MRPGLRGEVPIFYLQQKVFILAETMPLLAGPSHRDNVAILKVAEDLEQHLRLRQQNVNGGHVDCLQIQSVKKQKV